MYLKGNPDDKIHWFSITNSTMIVIFLTAMVSGGGGTRRVEPNSSRARSAPRGTAFRPFLSSDPSVADQSFGR